MFVNVGQLDIEILYSLARYIYVLFVKIEQGLQAAFYTPRKMLTKILLSLLNVRIVSEFWIYCNCRSILIRNKQYRKNISSPAASNHFPRKLILENWTYAQNLCFHFYLQAVFGVTEVHRRTTLHSQTPILFWLNLH